MLPLKRDTDLSTSTEEQAAAVLYATLREWAAPDPAALPQAEAELGTQLKRFAQGLYADPGFSRRLQERLFTSWRSHTAPAVLFLAQQVAWVSLVSVLVLGLGWALRHLRPQPFTSSASTTDSAAIRQPAVLASSTSVTPGKANIFTGSLAFPDTTLVLNATFPAAPPQAVIYTLQDQAISLTVDNARAMARQLGVTGAVYRPQITNPGETSYVVTDGKARVSFTNHPGQFQYTNFLADPNPAIAPLSSKQRVQAATAFLEQHGLLGFDYQVQTPVEMDPDLVRFTPVQDGLPVRYAGYFSPAIEVSVNAHGQVIQVDQRLLTYKAVEPLPLISAKDAWQRVVSPDHYLGLETYERTQVASHGWGYWLRQYPDDQLVSLYASVEILQPAELGGQVFITLAGLPVQGNLQSLARQAGQQTFLNLQGQFHTPPGGQRVFQLTNWEVSPLKNRCLNGKLHQDGQAVIFESHGQWLQLPNLPADVPTDQMLLITGVIQYNPEPTLDWSSIQVGSEGGGGGGGGGWFANIRFTPGAPITPMLPPHAFLEKVGDPVVGVQGTLMISQRLRPGGRQEKEVMFLAPPSSAHPQGIYALLEGSLPADVDRLQNLPIRVWGEFTQVKESVTRLRTTRLEEVWPDMHIHAWLGRPTIVTLDGKDVIVLTAQDNQPYVLSTSITDQAGQTVEGLEQLLVEGYQIPGERYGRLPVIQDLLQIPNPGVTELEIYPITSDDVYVLPLSTAPGEDRYITIEQAELIYLARDMEMTLQQPVYMQPVWRFTGRDILGIQVEILVQALPDEYLEYPGY